MASKKSVRNERVAVMVRAELAKDGQVENAELLKKARAIDPKLRRLTSRQFHGTYRLPALREAKRAQRAMTGAPAPAPAPTKAAKEAPAKEAPSTRRRRRRSAPEAQSTATAIEPVATPTRESSGDGRAATRRSSSASARPRSAEREAVRQVLQSVAREAMAVEDRASFIRLLDSLDQRAESILSAAGRG